MKNDRNNGWPWIYRLKKAPCVGIFSLFSEYNKEGMSE